MKTSKQDIRVSKVVNSLILSGVMLIFSTTVFAVDKLCSPKKGNIARAMFTTNIDNREPVDRVLILENTISKLYFFSDLRRLQGQTITHRWEYEGRVINEKSFEVKGPRWRVYSLNRMDPKLLGRWTVEITDQDGCPLRAVIFEYIEKGQDGQSAAIIKLK